MGLSLAARTQQGQRSGTRTSCRISYRRLYAARYVKICVWPASGTLQTGNELSVCEQAELLLASVSGVEVVGDEVERLLARAADINPSNPEPLQVNQTRHGLPLRNGNPACASASEMPRLLLRCSAAFVWSKGGQRRRLTA